MKKIYNFIIILMIFFITGCNAEYEFTIDKNNIGENIFIYDSYANLDDGTNEEAKVKEIVTLLEDFERGYEFYSPKKELVKENVNRVGYRYLMDIKTDNYDASSIVRKCYEDINITKKENIIKFETTNEFLCFDYYNDLENVTIKLNSKYDDVKTNASISEDNSYIWKINKDNYLDSQISIEINTAKSEKVSSNNSTKAIIILSICILLILALLIMNFRKKSKQNNTI